MLLVVVAIEREMLEMVLGPIFSNQVWSIIWLAAAWPRARLSFGANRCITVGKKPSMFEKWWSVRVGVVLNCLLVKDASSKAMSRPVIVTASAASFSERGIDMMGVLLGKKLEVINNPATILPQARRLIGLMTEGLFSLMGENALNRG